ncbi:MAG: F0F1 ATP synthase subunit alpha, partial [Parvibaculum sp.]|nr:F0F1 ATP synthase subunit alpha [Parvibaculum sp.]
VVIYAGVNGYLDKLPVSDVGRYEQELLRNIRSNHAGILDAIRSEKQISGDTEAKLKSVVENFSKAFA